MNHSLHSDEYNRRKENFEKGLSEIDEKYIEYFKPRPPTYHTQKHDGIISHFITKNPLPGQIILDVYSTELPLAIKEDLSSLFDRCWKN
ncbi:hypothetical protein [Flavobacterium sp. LB2P6]|uniref:hypothetical protein n=1 Tax=Flavobacterium sp. LB2P6 TaxID=3401714 RepID=UPI003AAAE86D